MVSVPTMSGGSYCVDAREVTISAYAAFLASGPSVSLFPAACGGKTSFAPASPLDMARPTNPVTFVDWCQAYGYCASVGRHLCGRIGGGPPLSTAEQLDQVKSEWFNACSKGGTLTYPYGSIYVQGACVDNRTSLNVPHAVGSYPGCVGGYAGLRDMSGNVQEWEDNCLPPGAGQPGLNDSCKARGGGFNDPSTGVTCATMDSTRKRSQADAATGFRCCR
jgi:formylglycine-generating enzyme required for sulfatase activity